MGVENPKVEVLQKLLNDKFNSGLTPDGKYGPKTADAIYKNITAISKTKGKAVSTVSGIKPIVQQPAAPVVSSPVPLAPVASA
jgi:peptidoglycan hydrolase-like protein with peptidoglycan-binding domain